MTKIFFSTVILLGYIGICNAADLTTVATSSQKANKYTTSLADRLNNEKYNGNISIVYPKYQISLPHTYIGLADVIDPIVNDTFYKLSKLVNLKEYRPSILVLPKQRFYDITKLPSWTSAIFYRGIIVLVANLDSEEIKHSIQHEMVHSALYYLTDGNPPAGWLDEGLAQIFEGIKDDEMKQYLKGRVPKLSTLNGGFTQLPDEEVPVAYAVSYFAAKKFMEQCGSKGLSQLLKLLREQKQESEKGNQIMAQRTFAHIFKQVTKTDVDRFY